MEDGNREDFSGESRMDFLFAGADSARQFEKINTTRDIHGTLKSHHRLCWLPSDSVDMNTPDICSDSSAANGGHPI